MLDLNNSELPISIWQKDLNLRYRSISKEWQRLLAVPAQQLLNPAVDALFEGTLVGHSDAECLPAWLNEQLLKGDFAVFAGDACISHDIAWPGDSGGEQILRITRQPIYDQNKIITGLCGFATDISREHQFKKELQQQANNQANWLHALQNHTLIANMDRSGHFTYISSPLCRLIGRSADALLGLKRDESPLSIRNANMDNYLTLAEQGTPVSIESSGRSPSGNRYWLRSLIIALNSPSSFEQSFLELFTDLTSEKMAAVNLENANTKLIQIHNENAELISKLDMAAHTDPLTGLANRRALFERGQHEKDRAKRQKSPLAIIALDIDHFKKINDNYGHEAGDKALECFANWGLEVLRSIDLLARTGGEEFVVLLPDTDLKQALIAAERLRARLSAGQVILAKTKLTFTASLGVTQVQLDEDIDRAIARADQALYIAKEEGRNCVRSLEN